MCAHSVSGHPAPPPPTAAATAPRPAQASRRPRGSRAAAVRLLASLLLAGALAYSTWVTEVFLSTGLSPRVAYVSELAAEDQPYGTFFRAADLLAGLLVLVAAAGALAWLPRRGRWTTAGLAGIALFAVATAADSRLPLSCAATSDTGCLARVRAGAAPWTHSAHAVSSGVAVTGMLAGMVLLTVAARRDTGTRQPLAGTGAALVVLLELAATCWTLAAIAAFEAGRGTWGLGIAQRLQVLFIAVWLVVLARSTAAERR
ncbi:DUF998 domain-containing protein [Streptomyces sp. NPDC058284]|uniref:DUF998 domain-containing protein n=1 Tax=unclassified Streptomyces TaxID=2593676 RepID=UPI00365065C5